MDEVNEIFRQFHQGHGEWKKFINYLQDKFFSSDKYDDFIDELYYNDIIDDNDLDTIKNEYSSSKDDDFEI